MRSSKVKECIRLLNPEILRLFLRRKHELKEIPVRWCTNLLAFSYAPEGWNPLVQQVLQFNSEPDVEIENSVVFLFHQTYQPEGMRDLVSGGKIQFRPPFGELPWAPTVLYDHAQNPPKDQFKSRYCGPSSRDLIEREIASLRMLYQSISENGYRPWSFRKGFLVGWFLTRADGQMRFIVSDGNHRLAVLAALGYRTVLVRILHHYNSFINEEDVSDWYWVKRGDCSERDALQYFNAYFTMNGTERAHRLGLLKTA